MERARLAEAIAEGCVSRGIVGAVIVLEIVFWVCAALLLWTHVGYSLLVAALARVRPPAGAPREITPSVTLIVAAHDESDTIEQTLAGLLALDYPADALSIVVASDASSDGTDEIVERIAADHPQVRLLRCPRAARSPPRTERSLRPPPRWWPSRTPTGSGSPVRCAT